MFLTHFSSFQLDVFVGLGSFAEAQIELGASSSNRAQKHTETHSFTKLADILMATS